MVTNEEKLPKLERWVSLELKESRSTTCLELEIKCCKNATQDCEVFIESEIVIIVFIESEYLFQLSIYWIRNTFIASVKIPNNCVSWQRCASILQETSQSFNEASGFLTLIYFF